MILTFVRGLASSAAVAIFVAGCAGSSTLGTGASQPSQGFSPQRVPAGYHLVAGPAVSGSILVRDLPRVPQPGYIKYATKRTLYVADIQKNQVLLYNPSKAKPTPIGMITSSMNAPAGLAVDKKGTLYVANLGNNTVTEYLAGTTTPSFTITSGMSSPYGIGVDSKLRVFVANLTGSVSGYKPGKTSPFETISGVGSNPVGVAVDSANNIWVSDDSTNTIYFIKAGTSTATNSGLTGLNGPIGVAFMAGDTLFAANFAANTVGIYPKGSTSPTGTISSGLNGPSLNGFAKGGIFFQSNQGNSEVLGYKMGQTTPFSTITGIAQPLGIASFPREGI